MGIQIVLGRQAVEYDIGEPAEFEIEFVCNGDKQRRSEQQRQNEKSARQTLCGA